MKGIGTELDCFNKQELKRIVDFFTENLGEEYCSIETRRATSPVYENNAALISAIDDRQLITKTVECYNSIYAFLDWVDVINNDANENRRYIESWVNPRIQEIIRGEKCKISQNGADTMDVLRDAIRDKHAGMLKKAIEYGKNLSLSIEQMINMVNQKLC